MFLPGMIGFQAMPTYEKEAQAFFSRLTTPLTFQARMVVNRFIRRGKTVGWWNDLSFFFLYTTSYQGGCLVNMISPSFSSGSIGGTTYFTPYFAIKGDGSTGWINHGLSMSSVPGATVNNFFLGEYVLEDQAQTIGDITSTGGGSTIALRARVPGGSAQILANTSASDSVKTASALGSLAMYRNSASSYVVNKGGSEATETRATAASFPSGAASGFAVFRNSTTSTSFSKSTLGGVFGGAGSGLLSSSNVRADFHAALDELYLGLGAVSVDQLNPVPEAIGPNYFGPSAMGSITVPAIVAQQMPPPLDTDTAATSGAYPGNLYLTTSIPSLVGSTATLVKGGLFQWGFRDNIKTNNKPNLTPDPFANSKGLPCRMEFSSFAKAAAAQLAIFAWHTGQPAHAGDGVSGYLDRANAGGFADTDWISYPTLSAPGAADTYFNGQPTAGGAFAVMLDKIPEPSARISTATAGMRRYMGLDYEVADTRSPAQSLSVLLAAAGIIQASGALAILYLNALNSGNAGNEGITDPPTSPPSALVSSILWQLHAAFDYLCVTANTGNPENNVETAIIDQLNLLKGPNGDKPINFSKLMMTVPIGAYKSEMPSPSAAVARKFIAGTHAYNSGQPFGGMDFWRAGGQPGGDISRQYNQVIGITTGFLAS